MAGHRHASGSRPLLFERLVGTARTQTGVPAGLLDRGPPRLHDREGLRASVERELSDLLNTRAPLPIEALEARTRSTIDYGVPDLSAFPVGQRDAMVRLSRHLRDAILAYEPRLRDPAVEIGRIVGNGGPLTVTVRGVPEGATISTEPVTFVLVPGAIEAETDDAA